MARCVTGSVMGVELAALFLRPGGIREAALPPEMFRDDAVSPQRVCGPVKPPDNADRYQVEAKMKAQKKATKR